MKKILSVCLAALMIGAAALSVSAAEKGVSYGEVPQTAETITVDGKADAIYEKGLKIDLKYVNDTSKDPNFSATAKLLWNGSDTLYVLIEVKDSTQVYKEGGQPWDGDCSEIFIDYSNKGARNYDQYLAGVSGKVAYAGAGYSGVAYDDEVKKVGWSEWAVSTTDTTITYEYAIKAYNEKISAGSKIGIEIDAQNWNNTTNVANVAYSAENMSTKIADYGYITLSGTSVSTPKPAATPTAPATFDIAAVLAAAAAISGAGIIVSKKRR